DATRAACHCACRAASSPHRRSLPCARDRVCSHVTLRTSPEPSRDIRPFCGCGGRARLGSMRRSTIDEVNARVAGETVPRRFLELAAARPQAPMLHTRGGDGWTVWAGADVRELAARAAQGLLVDRVVVGERVLLMMRNRPDFHWLDLAAQFIRATPVSIYNSSSPEGIQYLGSDWEARVGSGE